MSRHRNFTAAIAVLLIAGPLAAQSVSQSAAAQNVVPVAAPAPVTAPSSAVARAPWLTLAPTRTNAFFGAHASATAVAPVPPPFPAQVSRNPAMIIVGGAAALVGAAIGGKSGTIIMIGGGAVALIGLWNLVRQ